MCLYRSRISAVAAVATMVWFFAVGVLAIDSSRPEKSLVGNDTLTKDGRIGKITDSQGICAIRPAMAERWTPLDEGSLVMPGDWLRTDLRGANAMTVRLVGQTQLTIGPGSLVELVSPKQIRIYSGDVKVMATEKSPVEVTGPDKQIVAVKETQLFRIEKERLVRLEKDPLWLKGFEGRVVGESIGSLVANIDGRNTPLTVGYHKVTVDIRDQIARTVVEESFVNHTNGRLEGVFHFPLPSDASISGFGMWIGSELVEADVVEKQRAREIYETILRERRDPGLLEWSGGNIFKARVFPIEAHSEKRIKITYTQVLPLKGTGYCYSYALQSELLKQHPLRELAIDVKLNSVSLLKNVTSPTHPVRVQQAAHSARVEFTAQEYTPTRDFEVAIELRGQQSELTLIPHRRGNDGYFMALLTPPAFENASPRDLLPNGEPLDLLILADTSASLDHSARAAQGEFIATLLGSLTPKDRINLAGCDVECDWTFEQSVSAEPKNIDTVREFLGNRVSLGWTDLDKAFSSAFSKAGPKTQIVYVGDGIATTGDADPVAFGRRLRRLYEGKSGTCYAVSVGSSFEAAALKAIASCGGGSVRQISGEHGPQAVARDLLGEIVQPAIKDLKVEFRGLQVARVYPEELPNLPAGGQQIILARYLPGGKDQSGEVLVTGTLDGRPIRYASRVSLADAEHGNSFIPRLWARMHLDYLLQQGASQTIQDEIIALSEEYNIMTPYTSLLVLETDADRERFKVKRRFAMRDGEKFFAQGRDNVNYDLTQQQMRRAGLWRLGLRRSVLAQLSNLGRDASVFAGVNAGQLPDGGYYLGGLASRDFQNLGRIAGPSSGKLMFGVGVNSDSGLVGSVVLDESYSRKEMGKKLDDGDKDLKEIERFEVGDAPMDGESGSQQLRKSEEWRAEEAAGRDTKSLTMMVNPRTIIQEEEEERISVGDFAAAPQPSAKPKSSEYLFSHGFAGDRFRILSKASRTAGEPYYMRDDVRYGGNYYGDWLGGLFPYLPAPPVKVEIKEPKKTLAGRGKSDCRKPAAR